MFFHDMGGICGPDLMKVITYVHDSVAYACSEQKRLIPTIDWDQKPIYHILHMNKYLPAYTFRGKNTH